MASKTSAEVLSRGPMYKKVVMCLAEKVCVLAKLHASMSYGAVGHNSMLLNQLYIYSKLFNRNT